MWLHPRRRWWRYGELATSPVASGGYEWLSTGGKRKREGFTTTATPPLPYRGVRIIRPGVPRAMREIRKCTPGRPDQRRWLSQLSTLHTGGLYVVYLDTHPKKIANEECAEHRPASRLPIHHLILRAGSISRHVFLFGMCRRKMAEVKSKTNSVLPGRRYKRWQATQRFNVPRQQFRTTVAHAPPSEEIPKNVHACTYERCWFLAQQP